MKRIELAAYPVSVIEAFMSYCVSLCTFYAYDKPKEEIPAIGIAAAKIAQPMLTDMGIDKKKAANNFLHFNAYLKATTEAKRDKIQDLFETDAEAFADSLKAYLQKLTSDNDYTQAQLNLLANTASYLKNGGEKTWANILRYSTLTRNSQLLDSVLPKLDDSTASQNIADLRAIVKKYGKIDGTHLPKEIVDKLPEKTQLKYKALVKNKKEIQHELYLQLRNTAKDGLFQVTDLVDAFTKVGLPSPVSPSFVGLLSYGVYHTPKGEPALRAHTKDGNVLATRKGESALPTGVVRMNPKWSPTARNSKGGSPYYCEFQTQHAQAPTKLYEQESTERLNSTKYNAATELITSGKLLASRQKWLSHLDSPLSNIRAVLGTMAEIMYLTSCRIGGKSNKTDGKQTYGLSTLLAGHVKERGKNIVINYSGKSGIENNFVIPLAGNPKHQQLVENIRSLVKGKKSNELVFTTEDGKPITGVLFNHYLQSDAGLGPTVTAKIFRTIRGTMEAQKLLSKHKFNKNTDHQKILDWFDDQMKAVGSILQHNHGGKPTGATALASYVSPQLVVDFFNEMNALTGLRMPAKIKQVVDKAMGKKV